jgi:carbon starvation protein CstA
VSRHRLDAGAAVAAIGAVLLLVSLFLDWYGDGGDDGVSAWTVFETLDLVLAAIALLAISTFLSRAGVERRLPDAPLLLLAAIALLIVFSQLVNDPPRVAGLDPQLELGAWLGLAGAALMLAGAFMSVARVSLAFSVEHREPPAAAPPQPAADPETETVKLTPPDRPA